MKIRFKKLHPDAVIPTKAHSSDAGFDMTCISIENDKNIITYHTGIAIELPENHVALVFPRSSIYKKDLVLSNSVGVIDSGYRNEIMFKFRKTRPFSERYEIGERIGQLIIIPYPDIEFEEVSELNDSDRGLGGYGSTGK